MNPFLLSGEIRKVANVLQARADTSKGLVDHHAVLDHHAADLLQALARIVDASKRPSLQRAGLTAVIRKSFVHKPGTPIGDALAAGPSLGKGRP